MNYSCPQCLSDNTGSFPMVYQGGTTTGSFQAVSYGGHTGAVGTGGSTKSQSILAQRTAPPIKPTFGCGGFFVAAILAFLTFFLALAISIATFKDTIISYVLVLACPIAVFFWFISYSNKNLAPRQKLWKEQYEQWEKSWMCLKCGNVWIN